MTTTSINGNPSNQLSPTPRELIVIARSDIELHATPSAVRSTRADVTPLSNLLNAEGIRMQPLFGASEARIRHATASATPTLPDLASYYQVDAPDQRLDELAEKFRQLDTIEAAYVKPPGEPPVIAEASAAINTMSPLAQDAPPVTPDFNARQVYLDPAPAGIDARYAWTLPGGRGAGINIIDLEWGWRFTHEDLNQIQGGVVAGDNTEALAYENHGTAVIGVFSADQNTFGVTGICSDAHVSAVSFSMPTAAAIRIAADRLRPGDIMLLEIHRAGPRFNYQVRTDQQGYIAIEWWPDDFAAIQYATQRGILVVEAAGNGRENLDDAIYETRPPGFPADWSNPFNRANRDSGAIIVGAGAPPPGTHNADHGPDRSRLDFSNYGSCIDAQGWGREVTTTSYGDLQGGASRDLWYTDRFSGTSSASPVVVGALGCVQGVLRARSQTLLTPSSARQRLRTTGSPQQDAPARPSAQRIGNRPNLRELVPPPAEPWWIKLLRWIISWFSRR